MDKINFVSGILFFAAEIFAIASVGNPDWINSGIEGGSITIGLTSQCQTIYGRKRTCFRPDLPPEWVSTLFFLLAGIVCLSLTCILLFVAHWKRHFVKYARWMAFIAINAFCVGCLLFPIGFNSPVVGGQAFKLPKQTSVGVSYVLFIVSLIISLIGLLSVCNICTSLIGNVYLAY